VQLLKTCAIKHLNIIAICKDLYINTIIHYMDLMDGWAKIKNCETQTRLPEPDLPEPRGQRHWGRAELQSAEGTGTARVGTPDAGQAGSGPGPAAEGRQGAQRPVTGTGWGEPRRSSVRLRTERVERRRHGASELTADLPRPPRSRGDLEKKKQELKKMKRATGRGFLCFSVWGSGGRRGPRLELWGKKGLKHKSVNWES